MPSIDGKDITRVVVACEAGMGSSVLLTTQLGQRLVCRVLDVVACET
jgi:galactose PTS system EIIB component